MFSTIPVWDCLENLCLFLKINYNMLCERENGHFENLYYTFLLTRSKTKKNLKIVEK
jgi:hypothetical protein